MLRKIMEFLGVIRPLRLCNGGLRHTFQLTARQGYVCGRCGCTFMGHGIKEAEFTNYMIAKNGSLIPAGDWKGE